MTGQHETSDIREFSFGVGNRAASFRIPTSTAHANGKGYIEDRRPASNIDPYLVCAMQVDTGILDVSKAEPMIKQFEAWKAWRETADIEKIDWKSNESENSLCFKHLEKLCNAILP